MLSFVSDPSLAISLHYPPALPSYAFMHAAGSAGVPASERVNV